MSTFNVDAPAFKPTSALSVDAPAFQPIPSIAVQSKPSVRVNFKEFILNILTVQGQLPEEYVSIFEKHFDFFTKAFTTSLRHPTQNLENLETRGDIFYNMLVVSFINKQFPIFEDFPVDGKSISSRLRIYLVSKSVCAQLSDFLCLHNFINATDEEMTGSRRRDTCEDVFEAFIGAIVACCEMEERDDIVLPLLKRIIFPLLGKIKIDTSYEGLYDPVTVLKETVERAYHSRFFTIPFSLVQKTENTFDAFLYPGAAYATRINGAPNFTQVKNTKEKVLIASFTHEHTDVAKKECAKLALEEFKKRGVYPKPCDAYKRFIDSKDKQLTPATHNWDVPTLLSYMADHDYKMEDTKLTIHFVDSAPIRMSILCFFCYHKNASGVKACLDIISDDEVNRILSITDSIGRNLLDLLFINSYNTHDLFKVDGDKVVLLKPKETSPNYVKFQQFQEIRSIIIMIKNRSAFPDIQKDIFDKYVNDHPFYKRYNFKRLSL